MKSLRIFLMIVSIFAISGCHNTSSSTAGSAYQSYIEEYNSTYNEARITKVQRKLQGEGAQFISVGQDYMMVIPGDKIFYAGSPRIQWASYKILNDASDYLRLYKKVNVRVVAYVGGPDLTRNQLLAHARAINISNYLWSQDIDARLIASEGFSANRAEIAAATCDAVCVKANGLNSRVEITFRNELK